MDKKNIDFYAELKHETDKAYLVSDGVNEFWIPKSQVVEANHVKNDDYEFIISEWIAKQKGII